MGHKLTCHLYAPGVMFRAGIGGMDRASPAWDKNEPASTVEGEGRARGGTAINNGEKYGLAIAQLCSLPPFIGDSGIIPLHFLALP